MSVWVQAYEHRASVNNAYYMGFYGLFVFLGTLSVGGTIFVCEWGGWRAAQKLHSDFIRAIMSAPLSWFETVPIGRVTNRLSLDMSSIDRSLSSMLRSALSAILGLLFRIMAISSPLPTFIVPVLFASAIGIIVSEMYTRTAVILRRLTSAGQSPVFSHFANTLVGLPVIRATEGMHEAFAEDIATKLKVWSATAEANYNSNRWVASRIDLVNALISLLAGIIVLYKLGMVSAGLVGFSLQNATGISRSVLTLVRAMNDLELEMLSVSLLVCQ
jgi:ABC-type multidrug transport system fused ATPase/permease subunit